MADISPVEPGAPDRREVHRESWLQAMKRELEWQRRADEMTYEGIQSGKIPMAEFLDREERKRNGVERDNLTGLENRAGFLDRLQGSIRESRETGKPLSLMILDIDHFKLINDTYGHPVGDMVLRRLGVEALIMGGFFYRVGGEEIMLVLPGVANADLPDIIKVVGEELISGWEQDQNLAKILRNRVTLSMGACTLKVGETAEQYIERVDRALYLAKRADRKNKGRQRAKVEMDNGKFTEVSFRKN